jgi:DNA repair exonuclease SbcCD ATPase subunit
MSYGNYWTELKFQDKMSIIVGKNGSGKTSSISALTFALFGKPYSKINRPNLINSINNKSLLTEVEFDITESGDSYKIIRGMKPNIFEIYVNGKKLNQTDSTRDQQKYLEENVLKCNFRAFTNLVVLGANGYVPFMHQSASQRRDFIENILDINIFSLMNQVLREKNSILKELYTENSTKISTLKSNIDIQEKLVNHIERKNKEEQEKYDDQINKIDIEIDKKRELKNKIETSISDIIEEMKNIRISDFKEKKEGVHQKLSDFRSEITRNTKDKSFMMNHTNCPTCKQKISEIHKHEFLNLKDKEITNAESRIEKLSEEFSQLNERIKEYEEKNNILNNLENDKYNMSSSINNLMKQKESLIHEQSANNKENDNYQDEYRKLEKMNIRMEEYNRRSNFLREKRNVYDIAFDLLKDSGIKSQIISQYIPIINKLVSGYLQEMDFPVSFTLDKDFNESILSRYRDTFTYDSFSQGEKNRIDLALLFTWRSIAEIKNSIHTNILFFDEIFDGSLDYDGIDVFLKILESVSQKSNIFIISHKIDKTNEIFDKVYKVEKHQDFSYMSEVV